jgi:hypothetical protein
LGFIQGLFRVVSGSTYIMLLKVYMRNDKPRQKQRSREATKAKKQGKEAEKQGKAEKQRSKEAGRSREKQKSRKAEEQGKAGKQRRETRNPKKNPKMEKTFPNKIALHFKMNVIVCIQYTCM